MDKTTGQIKTLMTSVWLEKTQFSVIIEAITMITFRYQLKLKHISIGVIFHHGKRNKFFSTQSLIVVPFDSP